MENMKTIYGGANTFAYIGRWLAPVFYCCIVMHTQGQTVRAVLPGQDKLFAANTAAIKITGYVGDKLDRCLENRVMLQDVQRLISPFEQQQETDYNGWRSEYWGKWITSAILGCAYQPTPFHQAKVKQAVYSLLATQENTGYIGTHQPSAELEGWDVWGTKYVLLGLIAYYDLTADNKSLEAARQVLDHLMTKIGPGKIKITDNGLDALQGLSSNSILEPVALLYERTGDNKYKDYAAYIVKAWGEPSKLNPGGLQLVKDGLAAKAPALIAAPKAYEMMSCYEGLCEQYRITGNKTYLDAVVSFANSVLKHEITITGSGSNQELWCDGANIQTEVMQQPMETCVTVTWMKLCYQLLRLTGDSKWADQLEISLYNALFGAMTTDGKWWSYFSTLNGERVPSTAQHEDVGLSCCVANGPRGMMLTPSWAVMSDDKGIVINLFAPFVSTLSWKGQTIAIRQETTYPQQENAGIFIDPSAPGEFTVSLRIPSWSRRTEVKVNNTIYPAVPGQYLHISRHWSKGDKISVNWDLRGRIIPAPSGAPAMAIMRGPVVLALDSRLTPAQDTVVSLIPEPWHRGKTSLAPANDQGYILQQPVLRPDDSIQYISLAPIKISAANTWMQFEVPFLVRPSHFFDHHEKKLVLCDYASAGNEFSENDLLRVWLPQLLYLRQAYMDRTWKLSYPGKEERPSIPSVVN